MLGVITNTKVDTVRVGLKIFSQLGLLSLVDDKTLYMEEVNKMLGYETDWAEKKRNTKARKELSVTAKELPTHFPYSLGECTVRSEGIIILPTGKQHFVDEQRYGGNGKLALARSGGACEECGSTEKILIHHKDKSSNHLDDLIVLCTTCHGKKHPRGKISTYVPDGFRQEIEIEIELEKEIEIDKGKKELISSFWDYFLLKTKKKFRLTDDNKQLILRRLNDGYSEEQLKRAVDNFVADTWEGRKAHLDLIYCIGKQRGKPDSLEKWLNVESKPTEKRYRG